MAHVADREVSQCLTSVAGGELAWSMAIIPASHGVFKAGKLRYIAVARPRRAAQMLDCPTVQEMVGQAKFDINSFVSLVAPKGIPAEIRRQADLKFKTYEHVIKCKGISLD